MKKISLLIFLLLLTANFAFSQGEQKFAELGDFKLESGETIRDLKMGYRTFGKINADQSNVVLYLMWAGGRTEQLSLKPTDTGKLIDTNKFFVVAVDPLSNGVSSSPSNSQAQPRMKFPRYTMRDVVNSEYMLLTKILKINHLKAVTGFSMGGMQTFQWMISYPDFMDKAIPIVGSPQLAPYDLLHWQTQISVIMNDPNWLDGNYTKNPAREFEYEIGALILTTPDEFNRRMTREKVLAAIAKAKNETGGSDANNKIRQTEAMMSIDVTEKFGGSWDRAAQSVKAKPFIIVDKFDHTVTPSTALKFAGALKAETLILEGDCGHSIHLCEGEKVNSTVACFLEN